jgi:ribosome biogenesis protein Nip4
VLSGTSLVLDAIVNPSISRGDKLFKIYYNYESIEPKLRSSWVSYNVNKVNSLKLNTQKSDFDKSNQYLLHTNYNEINDTFELNHIALDNNRSERGYIKRGTSNTSGDDNLPDTKFREYTTLRTGNDQERGDDHISLTYVWYDKDIKVYSGTDTYFTTPSSIYPYEKLNINDTKFTHNGSIASVSPRLADKVFSLRNNKTTNFKNGRYLCTWLSGGNNTTGIWVDRYYYPDRISKENALSASPLFAPSFLDPIDSLIYSSPSTANYIFDKKSDLTLEPNSKYYYSRVGVEDIQNAITSASPLISSFTNFYTTKNVLSAYDSSSIVYDGTKYNKYNIKNDVNCTSQFTFSFDMFVSPNIVNNGYSIANSSKHFTVLSDIKITPFIVLYQDKTVYIYNTSFTLIKTVDFATNIKEVITNKPLDDFFVICSDGFCYKVNELGNKLKREYIPIILYRNYTQDNDYIYFLLNVTGEVLKVNKNTFNYTTIYSTPLSLYSDPNDPQNKHRSLLIYNNILYGIPGENVKVKNTNEIYFLYGNRQIWYYNLITNRSRILFDTTSAFNDFNITPDNQILLITDNNWYQYTTNREFVLSGTTTNSTEGKYKNIHVDIMREYTPNGVQEFSTILMLSGGLNTGNLMSYNIGTGQTYNLGISGVYIADTSSVRKKYTMTNFNNLQALNSNRLAFNITLTNYLSSEDVLSKSIAVDLGSIDTGYHTFTYRFDALQGNISLFIDGVLYQNEVIPPSKYNIQQILSEDLYVGAVGITNGIDLATYLKQPGYYFINSSYPVRNLMIYNHALKSDEIFALSLKDRTIDELILSIPCGQRNNIEEIERFFKYAPVTSSKSINIYVKNTGITNTTFKNNIKNVIYEQAASTLPVGVKINDIQFIDFK